jgi:hypothetical protein
MQAKSQDHRYGNDGRRETSRRGSRFTASTKGIRLTPDLEEWVEGELHKDPEETWSRMVRDGLRLLKKKREGLIQVLSPDPR